MYSLKFKNCKLCQGCSFTVMYALLRHFHIVRCLGQFLLFHPPLPGVSLVVVITIHVRLYNITTPITITIITQIQTDYHPKTILTLNLTMPLTLTQHNGIVENRPYQFAPHERKLHHRVYVSVAILKQPEVTTNTIRSTEHPAFILSDAPKTCRLIEELTFT